MHRRVDGVKQGSREGPRPSIFFALRRCRAPPCDRRAALDLRVFEKPRECKAGLERPRCGRSETELVAYFYPLASGSGRLRYGNKSLPASANQPL